MPTWLLCDHRPPPPTYSVWQMPDLLSAATMRGAPSRPARPSTALLPCPAIRWTWRPYPLPDATVPPDVSQTAFERSIAGLRAWVRPSNSLLAS